MTPLAAPTLLDLAHICHHLRGDNIDEYVATSFADRFDPDALALSCANRDGPKFVYRDETGRPVCAAGLESVGPGVMQAWMICAEGWERHWVPITRHVRFVFSTLLESGAIHRIEHRCLAHREKARAWYARLGLIYEGIARASGKHGQDMAVYARVKGDPDGRK